LTISPAPRVVPDTDLIRIREFRSIGL
jgi:hypothetical protein